MPDPIWSILQQALSSGSRSTVLKPLGWLVAMTLAGSIVAFGSTAPIWFTTILGILCLVAICLYFLAYIYFGLTDKDSLRSEKFSIQKLAIQKGFIGDDQTGYVKLPDNQPSLPAIDVTSTPQRAEQDQ